jgi:hypothetical protein
VRSTSHHRLLPSCNLCSTYSPKAYIAPWCVAHCASGNDNRLLHNLRENEHTRKHRSSTTTFNSPNRWRRLPYFVTRWRQETYIRRRSASLLLTDDRCMKICNVRCGTLPKCFIGLKFLVGGGSVFLKFADIVMFVEEPAELTNLSTSRPSAKMSKHVNVSSPPDNLLYKAIRTF